MDYETLKFLNFTNLKVSPPAPKGSSVVRWKERMFSRGILCSEPGVHSKLLVVEDDDSIRETVEEALRAEGFEVAR